MTTKTGLLLINLGTPDAPTIPAVRRYLKEFLLDPYVITLPTILRYLLVCGIILPFRPKKSAHAYQQIWTNQGSPLLTNSVALKKALSEQLGDEYIVSLGMRYGTPSIESALSTLQTTHCRNIIVLPLFPQFADATNQSAIDKTISTLKKLNYQPTIKVIEDFYDAPAFIDAYAHLIKPKLSKEPDSFLLFSYHGLPERQLDKTHCANHKICADNTNCPVNLSKRTRCYRAQCMATTALIAKKLNLASANYQTVFQSRLGKAKWIGPYTDQTVNQLREKGIKHLTIVCPAFVADCLETLEEIGMQLQEQWQQLGGETFQLVPCLNADKNWIQGLAALIQDHSF